MKNISLSGVLLVLLIEPLLILALRGGGGGYVDDQTKYDAGKKRRLERLRLQHQPMAVHDKQPEIKHQLEQHQQQQQPVHDNNSEFLKGKSKFFSP